jgi:hypothetical protein
MTLEIVFDRSRNETYQKCPRKRFLEYEYPVTCAACNGTGWANPDGGQDDDAPCLACNGGLDRSQVNGLTRRVHATPLLTGQEVHRGIEFMLNGYGEDAAVFSALAHYDEAVNDGLDDVNEEMSPQSITVVRVQRALIEALVRGWARFVWPRVEAEFDVIEVEKEERARFVFEFADFILLARTDAILRRKADGRYFVRNFKTISEAKDYKIEGFRYDTQTISEVVAVEQRLGHEVDGVIYDFLVKGAKKQQYPRESNVWHNASPLIWAFYNESMSSTDLPALAAKWDWMCLNSHTMGRGKLCEGGKNHTLGKGWDKRLVTDVLANGILDWFNWLEENENQLLLDQFVTIPPIMRTPFDIETWRRSIFAMEYRIHQSAEVCREEVRTIGMVNALPILDQHFPKHTHNSNCLFPTKCQMFDICWGAVSAVDDPLETELFKARQPNHPEVVVSGE